MDWNDIASKVGTFVKDGAPIAEELVPAWAPAIQIGAKLLTAAASAEPVAVSLVQSIQSGTPPTPTQLQSFATDYEEAYQSLHADIANQIATTPVPK